VPENSPDKAALKRELKELIIRECQKELSPEDIADDAVLIGSSGKLDFDSLDALQKYGKRIEGNNETRLALASINALAEFISS